jgi:hypothetical protein
VTDQDATAQFDGLTDDQIAALISDLQAIQATRAATAQQSQVEHEPGGEAEAS